MHRAKLGSMPADTVVLVVDDEMFSRFVVTEILGSLGVGTPPIAARTGSEALAVLSGPQAADITLVLLDFNMPAPNGIEVLKEIRSGRLAVPHDVVVVLVSGMEGLGLVAAAVALDADGYLFKPVGVEHLRGLLDELEREERGIRPPDHYADIDVGGLSARPPALEAGAAPATVAIADLAPGMVLAHDLRAPQGELLVAAGTPVTDRLVRLLRGLNAAGVTVSELRVVC